MLNGLRIDRWTSDYFVRNWTSYYIEMWNDCIWILPNEMVSFPIKNTENEHFDHKTIPKVLRLQRKLNDTFDFADIGWGKWKILLENATCNQENYFYFSQNLRFSASIYVMLRSFDA